MSKKVCTFLGHAELWGAEREIQASLIVECRRLVEEEGTTTFLLGNQGGFDGAAASALLKIKQEHPEIQRILVIPYLTRSINRDREWFTHRYDEILRPTELMGVHYKSAIGSRNRWMVAQSDVVLAYVRHESGGAAEALRYAATMKKEIINLACADKIGRGDDIFHPL